MSKYELTMTDGKVEELSLEKAENIAKVSGLIALEREDGTFVFLKPQNVMSIRPKSERKVIYG